MLINSLSPLLEAALRPYVFLKAEMLPMAEPDLPQP